MSEKSENVEQPKKKKRGWFRSCLMIIGALFVIGIIGAIISGGGDEEAAQVGTVEEVASSGTEIEDVEEQAEEGGTEDVSGDSAETSEETEEPTPEPEPTDTPQAISSFAVGDIVSINDYVMVVLGWSESEGTEFFEPEEGNKFVAVDLLFVNQGSGSESLSSLLQMTLKDDTGQNYQPDLLAQSAFDADSPEGELTSGERIRGTVAFQTPNDVSGLQFVFDASVWGTGKVFVDLGNEPISLDPPSELAGESTIDSYAVGETIAIGDFTWVHEQLVREKDEASSAIG